MPTQNSSTMSSFLLVLAILAVVATGSPTWHAEATQASGQRVGQVVALVYYPDATEAPGVEVSLWRDGHHLSSARTDASGRVVFRSLEDGRYTIRARHQGFLEADGLPFLVGPGRYSHTTAVQLVEGAMTLAPGSLQGRVVAVDGTPLPGIFVCVRPPLSTGATALTAVTDSEGSFHVQAPTEEPYIVVAIGAGHFGASVSPAPNSQVPGRVPIVVVAVAGRSPHER